MDISFYDWHYYGEYLQTPIMSVSIHSRTIDIIIPQSTFVSPTRLERVTPSLKVRCSNQLSYEDITPSLVLAVSAVNTFPVYVLFKCTSLMGLEANTMWYRLDLNQ